MLLWKMFVLADTFFFLSILNLSGANKDTVERAARRIEIIQRRAHIR
jgi:hypothetical protein